MRSYCVILLEPPDPIPLKLLCCEEFAAAHATELGIKTVESLNLVCTESGEYVTAESAAAAGTKVMKLSGTEFRKRLRAGEEIPEWFAFKSVVDVLRKHT